MRKRQQPASRGGNALEHATSGIQFQIQISVQFGSGGRHYGISSDSSHSHSQRAVVVTQAMSFVEQERGVTRVADLAAALGVTVRTLQRIFGERVGVSPKWVINRARLQDAAAQVLAGKVVNWSRLALELGFFDQAHLIRAYRRIIGVTPAEHVRRTHGAAPSSKRD